jgi:hypothetical protein
MTIVCEYRDNPWDFYIATSLTVSPLFLFQNSKRVLFISNPESLISTFSSKITLSRIKERLEPNYIHSHTSSHNYRSSVVESEQLANPLEKNSWR